jgi:hypothetical protein
MVGGNMRQAGPLAAAGIVALETMIPRLREDHDTAKRLAAGLHRIDASLCDPADVETNLVRVDVKKSGRRAAWWSDALKEKGVLVAPADAWSLRFVTHRHIAAPDIDAAAAAFTEIWNATDRLTRRLGSRPPSTRDQAMWLRPSFQRIAHDVGKQAVDAAMTRPTALNRWHRACDTRCNLVRLLQQATAIAQDSKRCCAGRLPWSRDSCALQNSNPALA